MWLRLRRLRIGRRLATGVLAALAALVAACGFGIDLDNLFTASTDAPKVLQIAGGSAFTCARRDDGTVRCWGYGAYGRLGTGSDDSTSSPAPVKEVTDAVDLSVGTSHACVVRRSGAVSCWGYNAARQLGDGTTSSTMTPKSALSIANAKQVAAGGSHSCALLADGTVHCWGDNGSGQLGDGTMNSRGNPIPVAGVADAIQVATAQNATCALIKSGGVYCWGKNDYGQAGVEAAGDVPTPSRIASLAGVASIGAAGSALHFCAILGSGEMRCWGYGSYGQLGSGAATARNPTPVAVVGVSDAVHVATGGSFTCAARKSGGTSCWGLNDWRQLGVGESSPPDSVSSPVPVTGVSGVQQVAVGATAACALFGGGQDISCWGANASGALGRGTRVVSEVPVKVAAPTPLETISAGAGYTCGTDASGALYCWGTNTSGVIALPKTSATGTPTPVGAVSGVSRVGAGADHTCAVGAEGAVRCWGSGYYGQLGNGANASSSTPVAYGAGPATDVGSGSAYTCALLATNEIACAGSNGNRCLGRPGPDSYTPVLVAAGPSDPDGGGGDGGVTAPPLTGASILRVGSTKACAIRGGTLTCWGRIDSGQRGPGAAADAPTDVPLGAAAIDVTGDGNHTCAAIQGGAVHCFGQNDHGQTTGTAGGPTIKGIDLGGKTAKSIVAGSAHTCALLDDGTVRCWGRGTNGEVGNGVRADALIPSVVEGLADVKAISAYDRHTCALVNDGTAWCWGDNGSGQLGDGTPMATGTPAPVVD